MARGSGERVTNENAGKVLAVKALLPIAPELIRVAHRWPLPGQREGVTALGSAFQVLCCPLYL